MGVARTRIQQLSAELWVDGDGDESVDTTGVDFGILPAIKKNTTDLNPSAAPVTGADNAEFNAKTFGESATQFLYGNGDKSHTVHNPFIAEAMLRASIEEMTDLYGAQPWFPAISPAVQQILGGPLGTGSMPFPRPAGRVSSR
jgi:hypothetical protein